MNICEKIKKIHVTLINVPIVVNIIEKLKRFEFHSIKQCDKVLFSKLVTHIKKKVHNV